MLLFGSITSLVLLGGVALLLKWMASQVSTRRGAESLTPEDLNVLEQSAGRLVEEIKETAAVAIRDLDDRCEELRRLCLLADQKIALWSELTKETEAPIVLAPQVEEIDSRTRVYQLADAGLEHSEIAREIELPVGEVNLLLGLRPTVHA